MASTSRDRDFFVKGIKGYLTAGTSVKPHSDALEGYYKVGSVLGLDEERSTRLHFDIGELFKSVLDAITTLVRLIGFMKPMMDTTKIGLDIFEESKKILEKTPEPDKPEQVTERVRAAADLMRSFAPLPFAELLLWMFRGFLLLGLAHVYLEFYRIRKGSK